MRDEPQEPEASESAPPPTFEAPHSNGAVHAAKPRRRTHAPWEFLILTLFVLIVCIGIVLGWTFVGLAFAREARRTTGADGGVRACNGAQATSEGSCPTPTRRGERHRARRRAYRAEDVVLRAMVAADRGGAPEVVDAGGRAAGLDAPTGVG